ncbi:hypothetical protein N0V92_013588, partial [Colletotrichum tropicale]
MAVIATIPAKATRVLPGLVIAGAIPGQRTVSIAAVPDLDHHRGTPATMILTEEATQAEDPGDFTFRMDKPSGVGDIGDSYRPGQGNARRNGRGRGRGGPYGRGRGGYQKIIPAERELLKSRRDGVDENLVNDADGGAKYRDIDELSDDEEADMDISDNSDDDSGEPSNKRVRRDDNDESGNSVPKWSNPDPYTALPPPDADKERKKKDMVKMIRKARVDDSAADKLAASTEAE